MCLDARAAPRRAAHLEPAAERGDALVDLFVIRAWKGATAGDVITLPVDASSCGYFAVPGDDLLIYAPAGRAGPPGAGRQTAPGRRGGGACPG